MNQLTKLSDADIKEIAKYVEEWLWYELEEEGHTFYTQDNMIYKALQAYKGGANERT
jgi:cytochrome c553